MACVAAAACGGTDPAPIETSGSSGGSSSSGTDESATGIDASTGGDGSSSGVDSTGNAPEESFDCATITDDSPPTTVLQGPQAGRGITFDEFGHCIGVVEPHLVRAGYGEPVQPFVPGLGDELDQIDILPGGDFVVARFDTGTIVRVTPEGVTSDLATDVFAYGVRTGPDGLVYTANSQVVHRIDPERGGKIEFLAAPGVSPRVVDFSPDSSRMYIGTAETGGQVWVAQLDDALEVVGEPTLFYDGLGDWHDGIGVDVCGYVYVSDFETLSLYRIAPDGSAMVTLLEANGTGTGDPFGHGLRWGSGIDGWRHDAFYMPLPLRDDAVGEVAIGVPYRDWPGTVLNRP